MILTVRQINEFADNHFNGENTWIEVCKMIDSHSRRGRYCGLNADIYTENTNHAVTIEIDYNTGHLICNAYNADAVRKYCKQLDEDIFDERGNVIWPDEPEIEFTFPMPETRGYTDTPERDEVNIFSDLDVEFAINEFIDNKFGIKHLYKWQLRQLFSPGELGLEEEEFDLLADSFCY